MPATDFNYAVLLSDFAGADEAPLSEGGHWLKQNAATAYELELRSHAVSSLDPLGGFAGSYWTPSQYGPDVAVHTEISGLKANGYAISARVRDPGGTNTWNGYNFIYNHSTSHWLIILIPGGGSPSGTVLVDVAGATCAAGDRIGGLAVGSSLSVWRYDGATWTMQASATDSTFMQAGYVALGTGNSPSSLGDLYAGTVPSGRLLASLGVGQ